MMLMRRSNSALRITAASATGTNFGMHRSQERDGGATDQHERGRCRRRSAATGNSRRSAAGSTTMRQPEQRDAGGSRTRWSRPRDDPRPFRRGRCRPRRGAREASRSARGRPPHSRRRSSRPPGRRTSTSDTCAAASSRRSSVAARSGTIVGWKNVASRRMYSASPTDEPASG